MTLHPPSTPKLLHEALTYEIIGVFYEVYNRLGYGFLESIYAKGLEALLRRRGVHVERECPIQLRNYLAAFDLELGILLHFGPKAQHYRVLAPQRRAHIGAKEDAPKSG